ncbi:MAG: glycerol-3-phosphate 1-O-acyltransferase PlsY [Ruminococcaceae bacterium]|nr:glycerol-3-phosphate 1-O-acyltransferase PlsY [Oscillospiraceae bacterium]
MNFLYCILIGYFIGAISPSYIMSKMRGFDIRDKGSHNAGASNVIMVLGKTMGVLCALLDIAKAFLVVWLAQKLMPDFELAFPLAAAACILGHIFPFYMKFKGGKGLACLGGIVLAYDWRVFLSLLAVELVVVLICDYLCIVPITASFAFAIIYGVMTKSLWGSLVLLLVATVILYKHKENIKRIKEGGEIHFSFLWNKKKELERVASKRKNGVTRLCIFDLDGTVLDTAPSIAHYGNLALQAHGIEPIDEREYQYFAGDGAKNLIRRMLEYRSCYSDELHASVFKVYNELYNADVTCKTVIFDGLKDTLDSLKADGYRFAIVSNKPDFAAKTVANALYGEGYFDRIVGQKEGSALKPDPGEVFAVMKELDASVQNCVYVGDTDTDMKTGKNAGLYTIGVLWGFRERDELEASGADAIVATPKELYQKIMAQIP